MLVSFIWSNPYICWASVRLKLCTYLSHWGLTSAQQARGEVVEDTAQHKDPAATGGWVVLLTRSIQPVAWSSLVNQSPVCQNTLMTSHQCRWFSSYVGLPHILQGSFHMDVPCNQHSGLKICHTNHKIIVSVWFAAPGAVNAEITGQRITNLLP